MNLYNYTVKDQKDKEVSLSDYKGKAVLVINTATECGFTPQYTDLEKIYTALKDKGLEILDFPCNQFGAQEPKSNEEIFEFATSKYEVKFPMFSKCDVNGDDAHPLWKLMRKSVDDREMAWNFAKFLLGANGEVLEFYGPKQPPQEAEAKIEALCL